MKTQHLILSLTAAALLFVACDKDNRNTPKDTSGVSSYLNQDWNLKKQPSSGFQIVTAWDVETIFVNF